MEITNNPSNNILGSLQYQIVNHCNLNCVNCMTMSPLTEPFFADIEEYERDLAQLAEIMNHKLMHFGILGGEPLLHPEVGQFVVIVKKYFPEARIRIVTNGLLVKNMSDEFWRQVTGSDIWFECSIYFKPDVFNYREMFFHMVSKGVKQKQIFVVTDAIREFWNPSLSLDGGFDPENSFNDCGVNQCACLENGKLYHCPISQNIKHLKKYFKLPAGQLKLAEEDTLDICKIKSNDEIIQFINQPIPFCQYCDLEKRNQSPMIPHRKSDRLLGEWTGTIFE